MKKFTIEERLEGDVAVLSLVGPLTVLDGNPKLKGEVKDLLSKGTRKILLSLEQVPYLDSTGIMELISTHASVRNAGARLKLSGVHGMVRDVLGMVRLLEAFETHPSEEEALRAFH